MSKNNIDICDIAPSIEDILKENQWLKIEIKELKVLNENLNKYIDNFRQNSDIQYLHDNQQIYKLKQENQELKEQVDYYKKEMESEQCFRESTQSHLIKYAQAIKILKEKIEMPLLDDFEVINKNYIHLYRLRTKALINEEEYKLLKEVFESVGEE